MFYLYHRSNPLFSFQFPPKRQTFLCQGMVASAQDIFGLDERQRRRFPFIGMPGIFIHTIKSEYQVNALSSA